MDTILGHVPVGGHINGFALQGTYALNERFSIVAVKDGYIDCRPDNTLDHHDGFADVAAGVQYSLYYEPKEDFVLSTRLVYEAPIGTNKVYQGNGDGNFAPAILFLKGFQNLQFSGTLGLVLPLDTSEENTLFYDSWHLSYAVTKWLHPLIELNHFHVLSAGDRKWTGHGGQDDLVAGIAKFNGCDIVNLGGKYNDEHRDFVTLTLGSRFKVTDWLDFGAAYEFPLTDKENGLLKDRLLIDAVVSLKF